MEDTNLKKYETLFALSKEGLQEENGRLRRADEKASRFFAVLSTLLGVFTLTAQSFLKAIIPPNLSVDWVCLVLAICFFLFVCLGLLFVFLAYKIQPVVKIPVSKEMIDFFDANTYLDIIFALTKSNVDAFNETKVSTDNKFRSLTKSYQFIVAAIVTAVLYAISILIKLW